MKSFNLLLLSTISIAFLHSLAPDHWIPFVMIKKTQNWSKKKTFFVVLTSAIGHVGSSILLGGIGIALGFASSILQGVESTRGEIGLYLLIGFGIAYTLWGLKHAKSLHTHSLNKKAVTLWALFAIFVLGPCEPLIPLMFLASSFDISGIIIISLTFALITIFMMELQVFLGVFGIELVKHKIVEKYSHTFAGIVIAFTGILLLLI